MFLKLQNGFKCIGHTSSKKKNVSPDIIPSKIDKNFKINYPNYSRSTLFSLPCNSLKTKVGKQDFPILYFYN